ncbi:MAG: ATP-binding protein, partial [Treponema sp.]|nr:ATP-binding protein [Treponema sp.]
QAHTYEANKSGSGLGLSIAKTLCDLLGAQITAQNNPSGGAQIIIEF